MAMFSRIFLLFLLLPALGLAASVAVEQKLREQGAEAARNADLYYDEIFDREGKIRPQYADIYPQVLERSKTNLKEVRRLTKKDFRNDNALSAVARIFTKEENEQLQKGTAQRGLALQKFLQDYYSGKKTYDAAGVIPDELVQRIVARAGESGFYGKLDPKNITFMYGPDIIRDRFGNFRVLEDNTNYLGLQGDLLEARKSLWRRVPEYSATMEKLSDPADFYTGLLKHYRSGMENPAEKMIFFSVPPYPDNEDLRLNKIWKDLGVEPVTPFSRNKKIVKKEDGFYLEQKKGRRTVSEKVGFMVFNAEFSCLDPAFKPAWDQCIMENAKYWLEQKKGAHVLNKRNRAILESALVPNPLTGKADTAKVEAALKKIKVSLADRKIPGLVEAVANGKLRTNNTPGTEFINDKEFNTYVEKLVRFYLNEEPILKNITTHRLYRTDANGVRTVDPAVFELLEKDMDHHVVKVVDGRGGEGVWVGPKVKESERADLLKMLKTNTNREVIVQEFVHPSVVGGDIVDIRMLAQIGGGKGQPVFVSPVGATRAVTKNGDGKVNLSGGKAHEMTVLVRDTAPQSCAHQFNQMQ